ncbi:MAG: sensor histidine kinase, partial [Solirubrobacteraceae bacterium]
STAAAPGVLALFAVAVLRDVRITVAATTATIVAYGLSVIPLRGSWLSTASTLGAWSLAVAAIGVAVRAQRAALQAARERALQAEATREEEAQRRVVDERLRIARELHDVIAHHASVINVQSGVAGHLMRTQPEKASAALVTVRDASRTVVREMGQLVELLRSTEQGQLVEPSPGLDQLDELLAATRNAGLALDFEAVGQPEQRTPAVDLIAYRVVQEAITNALKHGTGTAELRVEFAGELIAIDVRNPIAPHADTKHAPDRTSHGLLGMRERLIAIGGSLTVGPDARHQYLLHAEIPLERT